MISQTVLLPTEDINTIDDQKKEFNKKTLREVYEELHLKIEADPNLKIPWIIRLIENPKSPIALSGAVSLYRHDLIHCILGRGLTSADEAFVIGMTMGSIPNLKKTEVIIYKFISRHLFPGIYKFSKEDIQVYTEAVNIAKSMPSIKPLTLFNMDKFMDLTIENIHIKLGIVDEKLKNTFWHS